MAIFRKSKPILMKVTGGLTAQLLALLCAIYLSQKFKRPFQIRYFSDSTGTYWPFEIEKLLKSSELESIVATRGLETNKFVAPGSYIANLPLRQKKSNSHKFFWLIYRFKIDRLVKNFRREYVVEGKISRLKQVPKNINTVTGIFPPILEREVISEMSKRVENSGYPNPFKRPTEKISLVIHYRLGDMRKMPARNSQFGGHGVVDPSVFKEVLEKVEVHEEISKIVVVSDEPEIAVQLLKEAGFDNLSAANSNNPWENLITIGSAKIFVGSMSQFSIFGAVLCHLNKGQVFLPSNTYGRGSTVEDLGISEFNYIDYRYLGTDHWVFNHGIGDNKS